jgi:Rrf2 family protein
MKRDSKLFITLHLLAHLDEAGGHSTTSEELAAHFHTNPVVIRRTLAVMREAGIVASVKGHGGGWTIARPAAAISLAEVYTALGERGVLAPGPEPDSSACLIEQAVNNALDDFYAEAEALLLRRLGEIALADIAVDYRRHLATHGAAHPSAGRPGG